MALQDLYVSDDIDISVDPETYQDQTNPAPPLPGNYRFVVEGPIVERKDKNGLPVLTDGKFPVLTINRVKIVEGTEDVKAFGLFHDLRTKPFDRFGTVVSDIGDIVRAYDQTRSWSGLREGLAALDEFASGGANFTAQLAWEAYDAQYVTDAFSALGIAKGQEKAALASGKISKDAYTAIYKKARLGTDAFKPNGKGGRIPVATGPSGASLEARAKIKKFFPSLEAQGPHMKLGAFPVK